MPSNAREVYDQAVRGLPATERLRLAALILEDLAKPGLQVVESTYNWTEEDQRVVSEASLEYAAKLYPEDEGLV
jgi:hypothetical protein